MKWSKENQDLALLDDEFVVALLEQRQRELYARVISLTVDEEPIEYIEGKVTSGSINIDGNSSVRRSCSLSLIAEDVNITDYYWGLNTKFKLFIGLKNNLTNEFSPEDSIYPEIVWFPQGTYVISNFSTSLSVNSCTISISGKDKMCLLNGELGGQLYAQVDFGQEEELLTKFTKVDTSATGNIDAFWSGQYYKKGITDTSLEISNNTTEYGFTRKETGNFDAGSWYKEFGETVYKYYRNAYIDEEDASHSEEGIKPNPALYLDYYDGYTRVNKPSDIFEKNKQEINKTDNFMPDTINYYIPTGYEYKDKNGNIIDGGSYYVQESSITPNSGRIYYHLIDLYRKEEEQTITKIPLKKIIVQAVHAFAKEPFHNIIINDVDDYGLEQTTYKGDKTVVAFRDVSDGEFKNLAFVDNFINNKSSGIYYNDDEDKKKFYFSENDQEIDKDTLTEDSTGTAGDSISHLYLYKEDNKKDTPNVFHNGLPNGFPETKPYPKFTYKEYTLATFDYGEDLGYRITPLVYPDDLITNLGDSLTSVLDKIKTMLGDFEYFYDVDGRFVFQRQKTYVNVSFDKFEETLDENYVNYNEANNKFSFNFEGNRLLTQITNTPVLTNLKNDYAIWGKRKGITGADIPIHARYAIDKKPTSYQSLRGILYYTDEALDSMYKSLIDSSQQKPSYVKDTASIPQWLCDLEGPDVTPQTSLWWNIYDWSEYYKFLTGAYPSQQLKYYTSGFQKAIVNENNIDRFPSTYQSRTHWAWSPHRQDCIDIETATGKVATQGLMHTTCNHLYSWFRQRGAELGTSIASFIYNPTLPTPEIIAADQSAAGIDPSGGLIDRIGESSEYVKKVDWREIIYQMALDYFAAGGSVEQPLDLYQIKEDANGNFTQEKSTYQLTEPDDLLVEIALRNPDEYPTGYTGYEQYYTDLQGFWRQLYNPDYHPEAIWTAGELKTTKKRNEDNGFYTIVKTWTDDKISDLKFDYYIKSSSTNGMSDDKKDTIRKHFPGVGSRLSEDVLEKYTQYVNDDRAGWNTLVFDNPETLNFWFDFFEGDELGKYSTQLVGDRSKTVNDDKVNAIIFKEIPRIILYNKEEERNIQLDDAFYEKSGYQWVFIPPSFNQYLNISYRSKSAKDKINEMLYQYGYCTENVSITALPIYHLQPNTRIYVQDQNTGINGEYIVTRISLPLTYNGTMSITANKAPERII